LRALDSKDIFWNIVNTTTDKKITIGIKGLGLIFIRLNNVLGLKKIKKNELNSLTIDTKTFFIFFTFIAYSLSPFQRIESFRQDRTLKAKSLL
jgi:hypothetical protein